MPPFDAKVALPSTLKLPPTFAFLKIPIPPLVVNEPVDVDVDSVVSSTKIASLDCNIPSESIIRFPEELNVFPLTFKLPKVEIPVTLKLLTFAEFWKLALPETFKEFVTFRLLLVATPATTKLFIFAKFIVDIPTVR